MNKQRIPLHEVTTRYGVTGPLVRRRVQSGKLTAHEDPRDLRRVLFDEDELERVFGPAPRRATSGEAA